jgi:hypothetical protein
VPGIGDISLPFYPTFLGGSPVKKLFLLTLLILSAPLTSLAWDREGHQAVASIAYDSLSQNQKIAVNAILKFHPWYNSNWRTDYNQEHPQGMPFEQFAFIRAASWPDDVRNTPADHPVWHYVNFPIHLPNSVNTNAPIGDGAILIQIPAAIDGIKHSTGVTQRVERAIMLSWLIHLVGDLHQPLHTVALIDGYPGGDHGGNLFFVRTVANGSPTDLHTLWDHILGSASTVSAAVALANNLEHAFPPSGLTNGDYKDWVLESAGFGLNDAYKFHGQPIGGSKQKPNAPVLPAGYVGNVQTIARERVARAGYRLGKVIGSVV